MSNPSTRAATPKQIASWRARTGHSVKAAAALVGVNERTFARWLAGETNSPKALGDYFRAGSK
jgi:transposase